jgi:hypothetical protein
MCSRYLLRNTYGYEAASGTCSAYMSLAATRALLSNPTRCRIFILKIDATLLSY